MQLCTACRVHPAEYYSGRGGVCAGCASCLTGKYGWTWMRMSDDVVGALTSTAADIQALKSSELGLIQSMDKDIHSSPATFAKIPSNVVTSWTQFTTDFGQFYNASIVPDASPLLGLPAVAYASSQHDAEMNTALEYQSQIRDWQKKLSLYINLSSPVLPDPSAPVGPPTLGQSLATVSSN